MSRDKTRAARVSFLKSPRHFHSSAISLTPRGLSAAKQGFYHSKSQNAAKSPYFASLSSTGLIHQSLSVRPTSIRFDSLNSASLERSSLSGIPRLYAHRLNSRSVTWQGSAFLDLNAATLLLISSRTISMDTYPHVVTHQLDVVAHRVQP